MDDGVVGAGFVSASLLVEDGFDFPGVDAATSRGLLVSLRRSKEELEDDFAIGVGVLTDFFFGMILAKESPLVSVFLGVVLAFLTLGCWGREGALRLGVEASDLGIGRSESFEQALQQL